MADHFRAATLTVEKAREAGFKRIGLVVDTNLSNVVENRFAGGYLAEHRTLTKSDLIPICSTHFGDKKPFVKWFLRWKPDCIITMLYEILPWLQEERIKVPEEVSLINWDVNPESYGSWVGAEQNPYQISAAAIDLVIGQLHRHEFGIPQIQKCTLVEPEWHDGPSMLRRAPRS